MRAHVVYDRNDGFDMTGGPYGYERVGFVIGDRVFWTGCAGSGIPSGTYASDKALAEAVVERWNRQWDGKCAECHEAQALGHPTQYETSCEACIRKFNERKWGVGK
jgi:hypothetical protein